MSQCVRVRSWIGQCEHAGHGDPPLCAEHADDKCWCGTPAVKDCSNAGSLVCGIPLCADHDCPSHGSLDNRFEYERARGGEKGEAEARRKFAEAQSLHEAIRVEIKSLEERRRELDAEDMRVLREWGWWNFENPFGDRE